MSFKEDIREEEIYKRLYNFIITRYTSGVCLNMKDVWQIFRVDYPDVELNHEFSYNYRKVIQTLMREGKIIIAPGTLEYIFYNNVNNKEQKDIEEDINEK